jgi:hypothetical protein
VGLLAAAACLDVVVGTGVASSICMTIGATLDVFATPISCVASFGLAADCTVHSRNFQSSLNSIPGTQGYHCPVLTQCAPMPNPIDMCLRCIFPHLRAELPPEHPASETTILKETLGHTPVQVVAGAGVGLLVGLTLISLLGLIGALPGAAAAAAVASPRPGL